ncbi:MAG TPA: hypothetical protein PKD45_06735 [Flavobacteriales bacterium]|mgnify:CR=1 FL=1|nr:hypothetical protein [Flavobacteriales bacterium]
MRFLAVPLLVFLLASCGPSSPEALCGRFFTPYPDVISQRERTPINATFLDAMALYSGGKYAEVIPLLEHVVDKDMRNSSARMYLVSAYLAVGEPYKAEMHLDFLENYRDRNFGDQVDWYNALCWLCEGNTEKAKQQAEYIAGRPHTYRKEAAELAKALSH